MANYLCLNRYGTYYFRCVIPLAYRKHFNNKREIRYSLQTDSKKLALPKSRLYRVRFDAILEELETMTDNKDDSKLITTELMTHWGLFGDRTDIDHGDDKDKELEHVEKLKDKDFERAIKLNLKPEEIIRLQAHKNISAQTDISSEINKTSPTWDEFSKQFLSRKLAAEHIRHGTMDEYQTSYKRFSGFAGGDRSLIEFDVEQLTDFYESMSDLAINTRNKHLERISSVFKWAVINKKINFNPTDGVMKLKDDTRDKDKRDMFEMEDLKKIFESDFYTMNLWRKRPLKVRTPYTFWMFPLALFTGARMGELMLLKKENVHIDVETPYIDLLNEIDPETGKEIKILKNSNSIRPIPIADVLTEIGFIEFVKASRSGYLFPDIIEKETTTKAGQKVLSARLKKAFKVWVAGRKSFHSLRHTFINAAALAEVDFKYLSAVSGHLSKKELEEQKLYREMVGTYFKGFPVEMLKKEVIDKLKFDVDFSCVRWPR